MKKLFITMVVALCAASVSAQDWVNQATDASKWAVGGRVLSGFQAQAEYSLGEKNYLEGRFGAAWHSFGGVSADFEALYNWRLFQWDWTPNAGQWFFDAGCGVVVGGREHYAYVGAAGQAKFGIKFKGAPVRLAFDWTPFIGPGIDYGIKYPYLDSNLNIRYKKETHARFNEYGFCNFGISCVYCF